jgi:glycosyltransferase involved in cell wall biosynthesis
VTSQTETSSPLVSVILPTYNRADTLARAVVSALGQTHKNLEILVIDDASSDRTDEVVASVEDERIRYVRLDDNVGAAAARNIGFKESKGQFVTFIDSDNIFYPEKIARQLRAFDGTADDVAVCVCGMRYIRGHKILDMIYGDGDKTKTEVIHDLLERWAYAGQSWLVRRGALEAAGGWDASLPRAQDYDLCLRLAERGRFVFVPDVLAELHYTGDSITSDPERLETAMTAIIDKHAALFARNHRGHSFQLYRVAKDMAFHGRYGRAMTWTTRALKIDPLNWRAYVLFGASLTHSAGLLRKIKG